MLKVKEIIDFGGKRWIQNMTWEEVSDYLKRGNSVILPVGQTEQHGPHLPMGTDTYSAIALAEYVAEKADVLIAPPLWLGWAPRMLSFPGSMTLRAKTLTNMVVDICESLMAHGFERFYIINGHRRENLPPLEIACTRIRYETGALAAAMDPSYFGIEGQLELRNGNKNLQSHACGAETAHVLYAVPQLVDVDKFQDSPKELMPETDHFELIHDHANYYDTPEEFRLIRGEKGVRGEVTWATTERGRKYHECIGSAMADYVIKHKEFHLDIRKPNPIS